MGRRCFGNEQGSVVNVTGRRGTWLLCMCICCLVGKTDAAELNLLKNPGFERDANADGVPDHWTVVAGGHWGRPERKQLGTLKLVEQPVAGGRRSVAVSTPKDFSGTGGKLGWEGVALHQRVKTRPMTTYTMSLKVYNHDTVGLTPDYAFLMPLAGSLRNNESLVALRFSEKPTGKWIEKSMTFQTGRYHEFTVISVETRWNGGSLFFDDVRLVEGGKLELSRWDRAVPEDRLLSVRHEFPRPDQAAVVGRFTQRHQVAEKNFRGDGSWESTETLSGKPGGEKQPPDLRAVYQRVEGYLGAFAATRTTIFRQRAIQGCDYLLKVQNQDGTIGDPFYSSGQAGRALVHAFRHIGARRFLDAAGRVKDHFNAADASWNYNYNMMLTDAALTWAQVTRQYDMVAKKLEGEMLQSTLREQRPWGGWPGHNSRIGYHCANLQALCQLYATLPKDSKYDPLRTRLKSQVTAGLNRMIVEQTAEGRFPFVHGQPGTARQNSGITPALIAVHQTFGWKEARQLLYGHLAYLSTDACGRYYWLPQRRTFLDMSRLHAEGMYLGWAQLHPR